MILKLNLSIMRLLDNNIMMTLLNVLQYLIYPLKDFIIT